MARCKQSKGGRNVNRKPTILYAQEFWANVRHLSERDQTRFGTHLSSIKRANVVMHSTVNETHRSVARFELLGRRNANAVVENKLGSIVSSSGSVGPFTHQRFHTTCDGKILLFRTSNIIRAGKSSHGDAVKGVISFARLMGGWPTAMSIPNTVASCAYSRPIDESVRDDWRAVWTTKFPGIAITFRDIAATVELFLKRSNWIAPGVKNPKHLVDSINKMCELWDTTNQHCEPDMYTMDRTSSSN